MNFPEIAQTYGTPFFHYDGEVIESTYKELRACLPTSLEIFYSLKANPNITIFSFLHSLGARAEVSSLAELETALMVGANPKDIIYLGPGKQYQELEILVNKAVFAIVCESFEELTIVDRISQQRGLVTDVALRVNPAFSAKGSRLTMGGKARQFGIDEALVMENAGKLGKYKGVRVLGVHAYLGTRILEEEEVFENTRNIFALARNFERASGIELRMVDIGGGLGVPYFEGEKKIDPRKLGKLLSPLIDDFHQEYPLARLIMESGRYLVAESGMMVSRALYIKESVGESFVVTNGGTNCHMAAVGVGGFVKRNFPLVNLSARPGSEMKEYNVAGPLCTPGDIIGKRVTLGEVAEGDLIAVLQSGAYGPTASPVLFLSFGYPTELFSHRRQTFLIRERDQVKDLLAKQRFFRFDNHNLTSDEKEEQKWI